MKLNGAVAPSDLAIVIDDFDFANFPAYEAFDILVGYELMTVLSINGTTFQVRRGVRGTITSAHADQTVVHSPSTSHANKQPVLVNSFGQEVNLGSNLTLRGNVLQATGSSAPETLQLYSVQDGQECQALGLASSTDGYQCIASGDYCHAEGYQTIAGYPPRVCTISGTTVTLTGYNDTGHSDYGTGATLVLSSLTGGTGATSVMATVVSKAIVNSETVLTLAAVVTNHTAGKANMSDDVQVCHAEGYTTTASGYESHAEGESTIASGLCAHSEGQNTTASGNYAHAEGQNTVASGNTSHAEGYNTVASGNISHAEGAYSLASLPYQRAFASHQFAKPGDAQATQVVIQNLGSASPIALELPDAFYVTIKTNFTVAFTVDIVARKNDGSKHAHFVRQGLITNNSGTVALVGSVVTIGTDNNSPSWTVAISADNTNKCLQVLVTGESTVYWVARVDLVEVGT